MADIEPRFKKLRVYNIVMGVFHAAQGAVIVALSNDFALPVTLSRMAGPPGTPTEQVELFS
ncbi:MAG TPA: hypothetical protein VFE45_11960, partial [Coriobacteriia bacterium]|nr:hypothetical protein [Coriobacteriia bacterium]